LLFFVFFFSSSSKVDAYTRAISSAVNGLTFEPTFTSTFPFSIRNVSGAPFSLVQNYYGCAYTMGDEAYFPYAAGVSASDPTVIRCGYEVVETGCDMDVYLFGNYQQSFELGDITVLVTLAYWPGALNPSTSDPCSPQPSNDYDAITKDIDQSLVNVSSTVHFTISPSTDGDTVGGLLDNTMWYVCAWWIYTATNQNLVYPEPGWTNFTVTSTTTGYCNSPTFSNLTLAKVPIAVNYLDIVAYDGSWDTYDCNSVANTCEQNWKFEYTLVSEEPPPGAPSSSAPCYPTIFSPCSASLNGFSMAAFLMTIAGLIMLT